eukprot:4455951-Prymnesium_polylepis.1
MGDRPGGGGAPLVAPDIPTLAPPSPNEPRQEKKPAHPQPITEHAVMDGHVSALQAVRRRA